MKKLFRSEELNMKKITIAFLWLCFAVPAFGQQLILKGGTAYECNFLMIDSSDHTTGKTGLSPTVTIRKKGGSFASPSGAVSEVSVGWYKIAGNATDSNTDGQIQVHATGSGADPSDSICGQVVEFDPNATAPSIAALASAVQEETCAAHTTTGTIGDTICDRSSRVYPASTAFIHSMQFFTSAGALVTSGTPSCTRRIDSGSFGGTTNSASAVDSNGLSRITISTTDTAATSDLVLKCTLATAVDYYQQFHITP